MRRAAKIDKSQPAIVAGLERAGWGVSLTHAVGGDFPDLVVACGGWTALVECKTGNNKLTLGQQEFREKWPGVVIVGRTPEQTLKDLERARLEAMSEL